MSTDELAGNRGIEYSMQFQLEFEKLISDISAGFISQPIENTSVVIIHGLEKISRIIGAVRANVFLIDAETHCISNTHEWSEDSNDTQIEILQNIPVSDFHYTVRHLAKKKNVIFNTPGDISAETQGEKIWFEKYGFRSMLLIPMTCQNKLTGTVGFYGKRGEVMDWKEQMGDLLHIFADIVWNAINREKVHEMLGLTQATIDSYDDEIYWMTGDARIIQTNPAASRKLGYTKEELLALTAHDIDPGFTKEKLQDFWRRIKSTGTRLIDSNHMRKDGTLYPVEIRAHYVIFKGTEYVCAFVHDITERKKAEEAIKKSEAQYRRIFENIIDVFYETSMDGKLLNISPSVEKISKYKREELMGMPMSAFYPDQKIREKLLNELYEKGFVSNYEIPMVDKDGSIHYCNLSSKVIYNDKGEPERIVGSLTDITNRKKVETQIRQLSSAVEQSPNMVLIVNKDGIIEYVNNYYTRYSGTEKEKVIGKSPLEISEGGISKVLYEKIWDEIQNESTWKGEIELKNIQGEKFWLQVSVSSIKNESGDVTHFIIVAEDSTERKLYEENLKEAKNKAEESDRLKSAFLANMSHEIRTPMNAILGFSSLLKEEDLTPEQKNYYVDIINTKGKDLLRIISDIIDISRIETGDMVVRMEPLEIFEFFNEIYDEYREDTALSTRPNLQFRLNIPKPARKVIVNTDVLRLKQIMVNLIQNAIKFTQEGYIEIGFEFIDDHTIRLFVKDSGIGIPMDKQAIIFDPFRQVDDSHTRQFGGTGLGLAISTNLVRKLGGKLMVESEESRGSNFFFDLHFISIEKKPAEFKFSTREKPLYHAEPESIDFSLQSKKILIAEDDGSSYMFLETILNSLQAKVSWARDGRQVIDFFKSEPDFDLILMDIRMPEINGFEVTRFIRESGSKVPIIAQTAYAQANDRRLAIECGCDDYISKPIKIEEFKEMLRRYLGEG